MRKFNVSVNGNSYVVEVEEVGASNAPVASAPIVKASAPVAAAPVAVKAVGNGAPIKSPMPGNICKVNVASGASVKKGEVLFVLEAMKMENDIVSPSDGVITVSVSKGAAVNSGDILATIA